MSEQQTVTVIPQTHVSPETAYVVEDYPYGFTLRCKIRYWIEYKPKHGFRLVSQTSNPKRPGLVWNKPKAGTYSPVEVLVLNEQGHVTAIAFGGFNFDKLQAFLDANADKLNADQLKVATKYARVHALYEGFKAAGDHFTLAARKASLAYAVETGELAQEQADKLVAAFVARLKQQEGQ